MDTVEAARKIYRYLRESFDKLRLHGRDGLIKVSSRRLARRFYMNGRSISRALRLLEDWGAIKIVKSRQKSCWTSYIIEMDPSRSLDEILRERERRLRGVISGLAD